MRIFTDNDKLALAAALKTFIGYMNGSRVRTATCLVHVNKALGLGVTVDEMLNVGNYLRLAKTVENPDLETYMEALAERTVIILPLKEDENWDAPDGFITYAECFHDFYLKLTGVGGTYTTTIAKQNIWKAISRNTLQGILSEALINEVKEKTGKGDDLNCYQYIEALLKDAESFSIDNSLSDEQASLLNTMANNDTEGAAEMEEEPSVEERPQDGDPNVQTEGIDPEIDESIHAFGDEIEPEEMIDNLMDENTLGQETAYIAAYNPRQYKRRNIAEAILTLSMAEIDELCRFVEDFDKENATLENLIDSLTDGKIDTASESVTARQTHGYLNSQLYQPYKECLCMQGMAINEEFTATKDLLKDSWDMRDARTRKLQKITELVYQNAPDDVDLQSVIEDLEKAYKHM